jgi:hypothetical protein
MSAAEYIGLVSACAILIGAAATYRNSVRKADFDRLQARVVDAETRLAKSESRASTSEQRALESRIDIIHLGEELSRERTGNATRLAELEKSYQVKINKLVLVIESLFNQLKTATGSEPDIDLDALRQMVVIDKAG